MAPTRRGLLAGVAALVPVASALPLAVLPAAPDALLLALCATFHAHQDAAAATAADDDAGLTAAQARGWEVQQRIRDVLPATPAGQAAKAHVALRLLQVTEGPAFPGSALDLAMTTLAEVAGVAPRAAGAALPHPDAELLAACAAADAIQARIDALWADPVLVKDDARRDPLVAALDAEEEPFLEQVYELTATTLAGHMARARTLAGWDKETFKPGGCWNDLLAAALVRDLVGEASA